MKSKTVFLSLLVLFLFASITFADTFKLPDTGQTKCYRDVDPFDEIPCAGTGQDGEYNINPMSFTDNGNGTVTDNNTSLIWQQTDDGNTYNWYQATGTYDPTYNPESTDICGTLTLGGASDWRLPSKKEMMSIVDYSIPYPGPVINTSYFFPNINSVIYWSSTSYAVLPFNAWSILFLDGTIRTGNKPAPLNVRCVRGGQNPGVYLVDNGNGTVTDSRTGLVWQQDETGAMTWGDPFSYCEGLDLGGSTSWRLPSIKELESLSDDMKFSPAIDIGNFPNAQSSNYWSSTTFALQPSLVWFVNFDDGVVDYNDRHGAGGVFVRCVRGGQVRTGNLEISPAPHEFGNLEVNLCSAPQTFTLQNTGNADLQISDITLSDTNFQLDMNGGLFPCTFNNLIYKPGQFCTVTVSFCPQTSGTSNANLTVTSNDPDTPTLDVPLIGTGIPNQPRFPLDTSYRDDIKYRMCDPAYPGDGEHKGIDIMAPVNTPVYPVCDGTVVLNNTHTENIKKYKTDYDRYFNSFLIIKHNCNGQALYGYYGHLKSDLNVGSEVKVADNVPIGNIREAYSWPNIRNPNQDHLHLGINISQKKYEKNHWGIAPSGTTCEMLMQDGWQDPIDYFGW